MTTTETDEAPAKEPRVADDTFVDPTCPATISHGYMRSYTHGHCICPSPNKQRGEEYRAQQAASARVRDARRHDRPISVDDIVLAKDENHEARYPRLPSAGFERTAADDVVFTDKRAACLDMDLDLFFPVGTSGPAYDAQVEDAKAVCRRCPIRYECLIGALRRGEEYGVFGEATAQEREQLLRRLPASAPLRESA